MVIVHHPQISLEMRKNLAELCEHNIPSMVLDKLPEGIAAHPDIQLYKINESTAVCAPECYWYYRSKLPDSITVIPGNRELGGTYPADSAYNAAVVGDYLFCNTEIVDKKIIELHNSKKIIHINQGYSKCNICPIGDHILFTEDVGIHNTIIDNQLPILSYLLPVGEVSLAGFPYGFLGGSCGNLKNTLIWYGNPGQCSYWGKMEEIFEKEKIKNIFLSNQNITDFGGIICFA